MVHSKLWNETSLSLKLTFVPLEGETQQLHVGHQGWGQRLHSMKYPQHRQHATLQRLDQAELLAALRGRGRLAVSCQAALDCGKAQHCRKGRCSVFYVGGHVCVYITNTMLYTHTHM